MKIDMHFYGTYAIARMAGFDPEQAEIIATSAQYVDDATDNNSEKNSNQEMLFTISTAHHLAQAATLSFTHPEKHRLVWVPFHFYPGGRGKTLEEKLLCIEDSPIVNQMLENHLLMNKKVYYLYLLGIAAHVYMDTFAHYGFSGICSDLNKVDSKSIKLIVNSKSVSDRLENKWDSFLNLFKSDFAEAGAKGLGHGPVMSYPDQPYLSWKFTYEHSRYGNVKESKLRDNQATFLEGCEKLHAYLKRAAEKYYGNPDTKPMPIDKIKEILSSEGEKPERILLWQKFILEYLREETPVVYKGEQWNLEKENFSKLIVPNHIGHCYRFHQAATYHRYYTLKDLLPEHEIYAV